MMYRPRRMRLQPSIVAETLESRLLLASHVAHHPAAHVAAAPLPPAPKPPAPPKAPHEISGTLVGLAPYTLNPKNADQGYDTYTASAATKGGTATYSGTDAYSAKLVSPTTYQDTYFAGFTVLYLAGGNEISISYVGQGTYPASNTGTYPTTFKGEAIGITGAVTGHEYAFKATLTEDAVTDAFSMKFTLKD